jgi:hypothetical protein
MRGEFSPLLILALLGPCLTSCSEAGAIAENPVHVEAQRYLTDYPFKVNDYDAAGAHGANDRIRVAFFTQGVDLVRAVVGRFCQADPA